MKTAVINSKALMADGYRIDPDIHMSEGVAIRRRLRSLPYTLSTVGENSERVFLGNIFSRVFVKDSEHGTPYLAASDTVLENIDTGKYLSHRQCSELEYLKLQKDWILITCSGTLGNVTYTNRVFEGKIATHDLIRVVPNNGLVNAGTLYAFLSSKYGYYQITQSMFGGVVKHINDKQMREIVIPVFPNVVQDKVDKQVRSASEYREMAYSCLSAARAEIQKCIIKYAQHTDSFSPIKVLGVQNVVTQNHTRLDPTIYINRGIDNLKSIPSRKLGDCKVRMWYPGIFKRTYVKNGYPYIKGAAMFDRDPFKNCDQLSRTKTPGIEELWLKEGMLLVSCAGLCGQAKIITKEYEELCAIGSPDIIRIESADELFTAEYLFAYMQLPQVFEYLQSFKYGSVIERFDIQNLKNLPVLIPDSDLSRRVTAKIREYMSCVYNAFILEHEAINIIEKTIEQASTI